VAWTELDAVGVVGRERRRTGEGVADLAHHLLGEPALLVSLRVRPGAPDGDGEEPVPLLVLSQEQSGEIAGRRADGGDRFTRVDPGDLLGRVLPRPEFPNANERHRAPPRSLPIAQPATYRRTSASSVTGPGGISEADLQGTDAGLSSSVPPQRRGHHAFAPHHPRRNHHRLRSGTHGELNR